MLIYTKYPEYDFTLFVSKGNTTVGEWLGENVRDVLGGYI